MPAAGALHRVRPFHCQHLFRRLMRLLGRGRRGRENRR
jgi:hypothetical protein